MARAKFFFALLAANFAAPSVASSHQGPFPNWRPGTAAPEVVVNTLRADGDHLLWNGQKASEADIREFLGIVAQMNPQPLTVLSYSPQTAPKHVQRARLLVNEVIQCTPAACLEITASPA